MTFQDILSGNDRTYELSETCMSKEWLFGIKTCWWNHFNFWNFKTVLRNNTRNIDLSPFGVPYLWLIY